MISDLDIMVQAERRKDLYREADLYRLLEEAKKGSPPRDGIIKRTALLFSRGLEAAGRRLSEAGERLGEQYREPCPAVPCE